MPQSTLATFRARPCRRTAIVAAVRWTGRANRGIWLAWNSSKQARSGRVATEADILKALEGLYGPGGAPLAGAVSGVNLSGAKAFVSLAGDPSQAQAWEAARVAAERAIKAAPGIEQAIVTLTAERAAAPRGAAASGSSPCPAA